MGLADFGKRRGKISRQPAGLEIGNQIGDRFVDVHRIDDRRAGLFHVGDRLVGDANIVPIGDGSLRSSDRAARRAFSRAEIFHRHSRAYEIFGRAAQAAVTGSLGS